MEFAQHVRAAVLTLCKSFHSKTAAGMGGEYVMYISSKALLSFCYWKFITYLHNYAKINNRFKYRSSRCYTRILIRYSFVYFVDCKQNSLLVRCMPPNAITTLYRDTTDINIYVNGNCFFQVLIVWQ